VKDNISIVSHCKQKKSITCKDYNGYINDTSAAYIFVTILVFLWPMIILIILSNFWSRNSK